MPPPAPPQCHAATTSIPSSLHPGFAPCAQTWVGVGIAWAAVHVTWAPSAPDAIRAPCERHPSSARAAERAGRRWLPGTGRAHARAPRPLIAPSRPPGPAAAATMDFGWPAAPTSAGGACSDLNLLQDGLLIDLDDKTLQVGGPGRRSGPTGRALVTRRRCCRRRQPATTTRPGGGQTLPVPAFNPVPRRCACRSASWVGRPPASPPASQAIRCCRERRPAAAAPSAIGKRRLPPQVRGTGCRRACPLGAAGLSLCGSVEPAGWPRLWLSRHSRGQPSGDVAV